MKRLISLIAALIVAVTFSVLPALAKSTAYKDDDYGFSISLPEGYTAINRTNLSSNEEFIERLGYSVKSFRLRMEEAGMVLYAADKDNLHQLQVKVWESDLSKEVKDLSSANDEQLSELLYLMSKQLQLDNGMLTDSRVVSKSGQDFLSYTVKVETEDASFCLVQDVTVVNGKCYSLVYYNFSPEMSEAEKKAHNELLNTFKIKKAGKEGDSDSYYLVVRIICAIVAIVAVVVAVFIISSFLRDIRHRKEQPEVIPDKIKMCRK